MRSGSSRLRDVAGRLAGLDVSASVALPAVAALTFALSFLHIGRLSLAHDEAIGFDLATGAWDRFFDVITHRESFGALHYVLLRLWTTLGDSEAVLRSLSAIFAVLTVAVTYRVGQALFDRRVALVAAVILAVNAYLVQFAQEARAYTLATFAAALATLLLVRAVEQPTFLRWLVYAAAGVVCLYAHLLTAFVLVAHGATLLVAGRQRIRWDWPGLAGGIIAVAAVPLVFSMLRFGPERGFIPETTPTVVRDVLEQLAGGGTSPGSGGLSLLGLYVAMVALAGLATIRTLVERGRGEAWRHALAFSWALVPLGLSVAFAGVQPSFIGRYQLVALPGAALLGGLAITSLKPRWAASIGLVLVVLLAARGLAYWYVEPQKDDWRAAAQFVLPRTEPRDALVYFEHWSWRPFEYHALRDAEPGLLPKRFRMPLDPSAAWYKATDLANGYDRVWVVIAARDETRFPTDFASLEGAMRARYRLAEWRRFFGVEVRLYLLNPEEAWATRPPPSSS